ncbi:MAG: cation-transporting P-type ATPase, partial [Chloroflexota bacterium]|nr:cation-transporting P-type ATPase [Chloroflexota bacterium]
MEQTQKPPQERVDWHALTAKKVIEKLGISQKEGLTSKQAKNRLEHYGPNKLQEAPPTTLWQMLLAQFDDFVVLLLIGAAIISALLGDWVEAAAIMTIVVLNAALGVIQEHRAEESLAALKELAAPDANVLRNG